MITTGRWTGCFREGTDDQVLKGLDLHDFKEALSQQGLCLKRMSYLIKRKEHDDGSTTVTQTVTVTETIKKPTYPHSLCLKSLPLAS
jgi:hypothetical protein